MFVRFVMFVLISVGVGGFGLVAWMSTHSQRADAAHAPVVAKMEAALRE